MLEIDIEKRIVNGVWEGYIGRVNRQSIRVFTGKRMSGVELNNFFASGSLDNTKLKVYGPDGPIYLTYESIDISSPGSVAAYSPRVFVEERTLERFIDNFDQYVEGSSGVAKAAAQEALDAKDQLTTDVSQALSTLNEDKQTAINELNQVKESNRKRYLDAVATVAERDSKYSTPENGDSVWVSGEGKMYRYNGTEWKVTNENDPSAIDMVSQQLAETDVLLQDISVNARTYKTTSNTWNDAIQTAATEAGKLYAQYSTVGGTLYYGTNVVLRIPKGRYIITNKITIPVGVTLEMYGAIFEANPADKTIDCFDITGNGFKDKHVGGTFAGFKQAVKVSTQNRLANLTFSQQTFHHCAGGIDTISFAASRSTMLTIEEFRSYKTDLVIKTHCDTTHIKDGWITHSGYNGPAIYNQGFTEIENVLGVPTAPQTGASPRWVDNYTEDQTSGILGERGVKIDHCRFGGEAGSCPLVYNYAAADLDTSTNYKPTIIEINHCISEVAGGTARSVIVLFDMPNRIKLSNLTGLSTPADGLIHCADSFDSKTIPNSRYISIEVDDTCYVSPSYPLMDSDLFRFLKTKENLNTQFRNTFTDGKTHLKYKATATADGKAKVTFPVKMVTSWTTGTNQFNQGASFLVAISSGLPGSFAYKTHNLYFVSVSGGMSAAVSKRLNYTQIASHGGGVGWTAEGLISSVHWGKEDTGSNTQDLANENHDVTIVFGGNNNSSVTIIPLQGNSHL